VIKTKRLAARLPDGSQINSGDGIGRRRFLKLAALTDSSLGFLSAVPSIRALTPEADHASSPAAPELLDFLKEIDDTAPWLTPAQAHGMTYTKKAEPWTMTADQIRAAGLDREYWTLEILIDGKQPTAGGNTVRFSDLVSLAAKRPVRLFKCLTDPLGSEPLGHGLWEGVAVRDVIGQARLAEAVGMRRVNFFALDDGNPKNTPVDSSLAISRVFEDPEGFPPVFLALKYNGDWISLRNGGPVRLIVPEGYENKCPGFLKKIVMTRACISSEYAAKAGIDTESPVKTCAMHLYSPAPDSKVAHGKPVVVAGLAQIGSVGLNRAQVAIVPAGTGTGKDDPWLTKLPWQDATILPPPGNLGADLPSGPAGAFGMDPKNGHPAQWPLPFFICRFGTVVRNLAPGKYMACFRSIDGYENAQPLPRPFDRSGVADQISHPVPFEVA